jgi:hypothetical protein
MILFGIYILISCILGFIYGFVKGRKYEKKRLKPYMFIG